VSRKAFVHSQNCDTTSLAITTDTPISTIRSTRSAYGKVFIIQTARVFLWYKESSSSSSSSSATERLCGDHGTCVNQLSSADDWQTDYEQQHDGHTRQRTHVRRHGTARHGTAPCRLWCSVRPSLHTTNLTPPQPIPSQLASLHLDRTAVKRPSLPRLRPTTGQSVQMKRGGELKAAVCGWSEVDVMSRWLVYGGLQWAVLAAVGTQRRRRRRLPLVERRRQTPARRWQRVVAARTGTRRRPSARKTSETSEWRRVEAWRQRRRRRRRRRWRGGSGWSDWARWHGRRRAAWRTAQRGVDGQWRRRAPTHFIGYTTAHHTIHCTKYPYIHGYFGGEFSISLTEPVPYTFVTRKSTESK